METNNKYYTPDKSEYHIGFEYQSLTDPRQPENDIAWSDEELRTEVDMMNVFKYMIEDDFMEHRCKFLDKEDIESFGFIYIETDYNSIRFYKQLQSVLNSDVTNEIRLFYNSTLGISIYNETYDYYMVFEMEIKNKSELKVLLKQLNIL